MRPSKKVAMKTLYAGITFGKCFAMCMDSSMFFLCYTVFVHSLSNSSPSKSEQCRAEPQLEALATESHILHEASKERRKAKEKKVYKVKCRKEKSGSVSVQESIT